jgi:DGQHR domain-containing protein
VGTVVGSRDTQREALDVETDNTTLLAELLSDASAQKSAFRARNSSSVKRSVHSADAESMKKRGWEILREGKRSVQLKRPKSHDERTEDRAWCLLYRMGYEEISGCRFTIRFKRSNGSLGAKQIDAFGCDAETAIVIECKSREQRGRRSLQKDIQETASLQNYIRNSVFLHFSGRAKPKLIWLYVTSNIIWSDADVERARDSSIYIITENELQYFETYLRHMGPAGRYQILGEFLKGQRIPALLGNKLPAVRGKLGGQKFYSFVTTPRNLLKIAFVNHQALNHPDGRPAYQRMVNPKRLKEIGQFISEKGGFFPTNLLINFTTSPKFEPLSNKENTDPNIHFGWLTLPAVYRSAWVIDGQHRLYGYSGLAERFLDQSLLVLAFDKMDTHKEADLFITINHKQKSVARSLLVTLLADLRMGDADPKTALSALASMIVRRLSGDKTSPFVQRFALPDVSAGPMQNLTISEVVNGLNRSGLVGKVVHGTTAPGPMTGATDEDTVERARLILNRYFEALRLAHPQRWEAGKAAYICVNPGIRAHLALIPEIVAYSSHKRGLEFMTLGEERFAEELIRVAEPIFSFVRDASDDEIKSRFSRKFGEGGVKEYLYELCKLVIGVSSDFGSDEFKRYIEQEASNQIEEANIGIMKLSELMMDVVVKILKAVYGEQRLASGEFAYWELGVRNRRVIENAFRKQQEDPVDRRKRKEAYLDIVDLKEIVESKDNWLHFEALFNNPLPSEKKGSKKYHTAWIVRFNDIRKIAAHKSSLRTYSDEDLEFVDWLRAEVLPKFEAEVLPA